MSVCSFPSCSNKAESKEKPLNERYCKVHLSQFRKKLLPIFVGEESTQVISLCPFNGAVKHRIISFKKGTKGYDYHHIASHKLWEEAEEMDNPNFASKGNSPETLLELEAPTSHRKINLHPDVISNSASQIELLCSQSTNIISTIATLSKKSTNAMCEENRSLKVRESALAMELAQVKVQLSEEKQKNVELSENLESYKQKVKKYKDIKRNMEEEIEFIKEEKKKMKDVLREAAFANTPARAKKHTRISDGSDDEVARTVTFDEDSHYSESSSSK